MPTIIAAPTIRTCIANIRAVDVRDASQTGDGSWTMAGYAAVFDQETTLYDAYGVRVREEIAPSAFDRALVRLANGDGLVHLTHGHDMKSAMASTDVRAELGGMLPIGGLEVTADPTGLRFFARVDQADPDAIRAAVKMRRKVVAQASFAFTIAGEDTVEEQIAADGTYDVKYRITQIQDLFDVCVCAQGAYPQTSSEIRSLTAASLRVASLEEHVAADGRGADRVAPLAGPSTVADDPGRAGDHGDSPTAPVASASKQAAREAELELFNLTREGNFQ